MRCPVDRGGHGRHRRPAWLAANRAKILATRKRLTEGLRALGFETLSIRRPILCGPRTRCSRRRALYEQLKQNRVLVRYMDYAGWGDGLRISVGTDDQIDACLALLKTMI